MLIFYGHNLKITIIIKSKERNKIKNMKLSKMLQHNVINHQVYQCKIVVKFNIKVVHFELQEFNRHFQEQS